MRGISRVAGMTVVFGTALAAGQLTHIGASWLDAAALGGLNTLTVTPSHGRAASSFVAVYQISPCLASPGLYIAFSWNGLPPGAGQALGSATLDSTCRATLSVTPPLNPATHAAPAAGAYSVYGFVATPTGGATPGTDASATYTVDVTPALTPTPTPTARSSATSAPTSSAAPSASPALSPSASSPATSGQPSASAGSSAGASRSSLRTAPLALPWWRSVGGLWLLGGVSLGVLLLALLALLLIWLNDRRRTPPKTGSVADRAA